MWLLEHLKIHVACVGFLVDRAHPGTFLMERPRPRDCGWMFKHKTVKKTAAGIPPCPMEGSLSSPPATLPGPPWLEEPHLWLHSYSMPPPLAH